MRVLVACEMSGRVRDAFIARGHVALSCDLLPSISNNGPHYQGDIFDIINDGWDLMVAFPPCTNLASSGARHFAKKQASGEQQKSIKFFMDLVNADIPQIAIENPVGIMSSIYRKPDQIIQPWQFGHPESKATCLWLKGLPKLDATNTLKKPASGRWDNQTPSGQNKLGPSPTRAIVRSLTYQNIATAMATQWG